MEKDSRMGSSLTDGNDNQLGHFRLENHISKHQFL